MCITYLETSNAVLLLLLESKTQVWAVPRIISLTLAIHKSFPRENKPTTRYPLYRTSSAPTTSYPVQFPLTHGGGKSLGAGLVLPVRIPTALSEPNKSTDPPTML